LPFVLTLEYANGKVKSNLVGFGVNGSHYVFGSDDTLLDESVNNTI